MTDCGTLTIETERLILRRFELSDVSDVHSLWASLPEVQLEYGEPVYETEEDVRKLLETYIGRYDEPYRFRWAIIEKACGKCIGQVAYFFVDARNHFAEIEYCISPSYQNRGYATEATKAVIDFGFDKIGLHKVQICRRANNVRSGRVIDKCGFHFDGALRDYFYFNGEYVDRLFYSILENER